MGDDRGAVAVVSAVVTTLVLFVVAALSVDVGNSWARRGQLQTQVDNAALFAGQYLPAALTSTKTKAAKAAIWYIACNPVAGQDADYNAAFPIPRDADGDFVCDGSSFNPLLTTYDSAAAAMIADQTITFPNRYEISIRSPYARVGYGFGAAFGQDGSIQQRTATAHVYSAGNLLPMGGSVGCIAAAANNTQLLGAGTTLQNIVPINYFSAGVAGTGQTGSSTTAPTWTTPLTIGSTSYDVPQAVPAPKNRTWTTKGDLTLTSVTPSSDYTTMGLTFTANANFPGSVLPNSVIAALPALSLSGSVFAVFRRVNGSGATETQVSPAVLSALGSATVSIPSAVQSAPGDWYVKIVYAYPNYSKVDVTVIAVTTTTYSQSLSPATTGRLSNSAALKITVPASSAQVTNLDNFLSCAKPTVSPRVPSAGSDSLDMISNIRTGLDHDLSQHPTLVTAANNLPLPLSTTLSTLTNPAGVLSDPSKFALSCSATDGVSVLDTAANHASYPNCLTVNTTKSWSYEFTQGFLTSSGRLSCSVASCRHGTFSGSSLYSGLSGTYNNDLITDYISGSNKQSVLDDMLLTSLDTFLLPSVPVATPANLLSQDLYSSPRFFWAPVLTTVYTGNTNASYPVLTFRPTFITAETPTVSGLQQLLNGFGVETINDLTALTSSGIATLLGLGSVSGLLSSLGLSSTTANVLTTLHDPTKVEKYGMVVDTSAASDSFLKAVRVMNINPGALPAVDPNYAGPVNDYLGSGPKIVRLVK